jgi:predicted membrane channel-forming protein YqfA (hemolysin III family)
MSSWDERSEEEEGFNALSHGAWAVASLCVYFWALSTGALGLSVAAWGAIISGLTSTIYHASPTKDVQARDVTRRLEDRKSVV